MRNVLLMPNLWKCPLCNKVVDYQDSEPSKGQTTCNKTGEMVQMVKVLDKDTAK